MESIKTSLKNINLSVNNLELTRNSDPFPVLPLVHTDTFFIKDHNDDDVEYTLVVIKFSDSWQIFLTYSDNVAAWLCSSADLSHSDIYTVRVLLGDRTKEHLKMYSRNGIKILYDCLKESNKLNKYSPTDELILLMALDIKDDSSKTFHQIMERLKSTFKMLV
ncbi:conserved hypothetical protein [Theileria orientalis strain Shintoku]|uniref:Proteasome assembly chaperone 3 n=1 Tax=Theileria orientalis strain Shintoku TaxID=869250 RepID=J4C306_THEOR|nr:conserved hypothetical protein [Theileria orientalis strain Shintoku]PVC49620.1 hypothetical protein MACL_00002920 [Theileria orientalis]BAM39606.1 conserved hypothetical protein [Theileria orientalis strain Shintoku]|eukprot:XP_009689907.1 conserved hypothetical protein [Theileria orientalis strain Shintoku]